MLVAVVVAAAALTYLSRAAALVVLPPPTGRIQAVIGRLPAPLFAGLAVLALLGPGGDLPSVPMLLAAAAALVAVPTRSLAVILVAGLAAYAGGIWISSP